MLHIYYADISALPDDPGSLPLSSYRLKQLSSCRAARRRRQGLGAELLLIHALRCTDPALKLPLSIAVQAGGKPFLSHSSLHFSLSHSGDIVACALSDKAIGIDLEREGPLHDALLSRCFFEPERQWILRSPDPSSAFIEAWTRKESYLKATGEGLRALHRISILDPPENAAFYHTELGQLHLSVCVLDAPAVPDLLEQVDLANAFSILSR